MHHLFVNCLAVAGIWDWIFPLFRLHFNPTYETSEFFQENLISNFSFSTKLLWFLSVCNVFWCVWTERNSLKHDGGVFEPYRFKQKVTLSISEFASLIFSSSSAPQSVPIFRLLGLSQLRPTAPRIIQVIWYPPPPLWVKVNTDGSYHDQLQAGCGGVFRGSEASFLGAFTKKVVVPCALDAELIAVIEAIRLACLKGWLNLWVEVDSLILLSFINDPLKVPWRLRTQWKNCLHMSRQLNIHFSHIYREGNSVADKLATFGALHGDSVWWDVMPQFLHLALGGDFSGRPSYRFA
ncbi:uncharacterized protein LOC133744833 [Rosa rugosa]|uniref:uncharacterized protein LOC133744833 n=1 Tax=Rosa rugosa TaxID=74645 RepID=UPI002B40B61F|nr:uncharacterized protein LOC133744833 [Rosa rugosa]